MYTITSTCDTGIKDAASSTLCKSNKVYTITPNSQSWALALFFQVRSPLIFLPRIAIALALILQIFRFAHRSIALKKTAVRSWKRALKRKIAPKTTAVRFLKIRALTPPPPLPPSVNKICMYRVKELPPGAGRGGQTVQVHTT